MSRSTWFKAAVMAFILAVAFAAMASEGGAKISVLSPIQVHGKQLAAGEYKVSWKGTDANVQVTFKQGKSDVVTATAKLVERGAPAAHTAVVNEGGTLKELQVAGQKTILVFND